MPGVRTKRRVRVSTLTATAALILAVFGPVSAGAAAKSDAPADTQIDWSPCPSSEFGDEVAAAVQCAIVDVPVDYRHPRGPTLSLRIARRPATVSPSLGPLFVNPGGPGASAVSFATTFAAREAFLPRQGLSLDQFDVIGMDPRGVGGSTRLQCPEASELPQIVVSQPGEPLTPSERAMTVFAEGCADDPNVRFFGTNNVARDMDRVRELLGADTITYLGTSYGTEIGAAYLNLFPNHVRAAVLDAAADPTEDYVAFAIKRIRAQTRAFERYLDHCESDDCAWTKGADPDVHGSTCSTNSTATREAVGRHQEERRRSRGVRAHSTREGVLGDRRETRCVGRRRGRRRDLLRGRSGSRALPRIELPRLPDLRLPRRADEDRKGGRPARRVVPKHHFSPCAACGRRPTTASRSARSGTLRRSSSSPPAAIRKRRTSLASASHGASACRS